MKVTLLGCGSSGGVPLVNGHWGNCDPGNPRNRRRRASVLIEEGGRRLLIDTSPDLRLQMLDAMVDRLDAVLFTHDHADHCHGLDDLRAFAFLQGPIPAYMSAETQQRLAQRFGYALFSLNSSEGLYRPMLDDRVISLAPFEAAGFPVLPILQDHGYGQSTLGFRIRNFAYSTDVVNFSQDSLGQLQGLDLWIVDCLQEQPHSTHAHLARSLEWIAEVKPKRAVLTHMNHTLDYDWLAVSCPTGVEPGYDGLVVTL
jgi:phosphoribosyl 1,2-cyclic phosphate phosphodiesterase